MKTWHEWIFVGTMMLPACGTAVAVDPDGPGDSESANTGATDGGTTGPWGTSTTFQSTSATEATAYGTDTTGTTYGSSGGWSTGDYVTSDSWGTSWGTWGSSGGWEVLYPEDCDYLGPQECEGQGGEDFACVRRVGHRLDSAASCSFDTFTDMCIAIAIPEVEECAPLPSCPALGADTIWAGEWDFEPVVVVQQACDDYPTLDYCISSSPDPRCACACAADVAGTEG